MQHGMTMPKQPEYRELKAGESLEVGDVVEIQGALDSAPKRVIIHKVNMRYAMGRAGNGEVRFRRMIDRLGSVRPVGEYSRYSLTRYTPMRPSFV